MSRDSIIIIGHAISSIHDWHTGKTIPVDREGVNNLATFDIGGDVANWFHPRKKEYFFAHCGIHHGDNRIMIDDYCEDLGVLNPDDFIRECEDELEKNSNWENLRICMNCVKAFHDLFGDDLIILHYGS